MSASTEELARKAESALLYIRDHSDGITQSNLWKNLGIDSRTCSRIIKYLEDNDKITRQEAKGGTYLIKARAPERIIDPMLFMAGDLILPCVACTEECDIPTCKMLEDWIYELVFAEME